MDSNDKALDKSDVAGDMPAETAMTDKTAEPTPHIGARLRAEREARGLTFAQIGLDLRVKPSYFEAIENLDKASLPSIGYVLGYVRSYAEYLGMNGKAAVADYKVDSEVPKNLGMRELPHFVPKRHIRLPKGFFPATTMLSCAGVLAVWYASNIEAKSSALTTVNQIHAQTYTEETKPADPDLMTIKAVAPSWIEIKDNRGKVIISRILVAGESWQADVHKGITLSARDGGALELYLGDELMGRLGTKGVPMYDIPMPSIHPDFMAQTAQETLGAQSETTAPHVEPTPPADAPFEE